MFRRLYILLIALVISTGMGFAARNWEEVTAPPAKAVQQDRQLFEQEGVEMQIHDGAVYIMVSKPIQIKVFTILGQIISSETVQPGIYRLKLNSKGIYILRIGTQTRRITL